MRKKGKKMETVLFCSSIILVLVSGYLYFNRKDDKPIVDWGDRIFKIENDRKDLESLILSKERFHGERIGRLEMKMDELEKRDQKSLNVHLTIAEPMKKKATPLLDKAGIRARGN